jgi:hypothetical protein
MNQAFIQLAEIRKQLVNQQSLINDTLTLVDKIIMQEIQTGNNKVSHPIQIRENLEDYTKAFPPDLVSKRDKLKHILGHAKQPLSARDIKKELLKYGEELSNVDQSLVNLAKDQLIQSIMDGGKRKYCMP